MKTISVIVPVYNTAKYLRKCLDSIIGQTYPSLDIILVDDGTKDEGGEICDEYQRRDERITVIHQENGGLSSARNAGLRVARGEYIGFVDSDDWIAPDMYQYLIENAEKHDADITACCHYRVVPGKKISSVCDGIDRILSVDSAMEQLIYKNGVNTYFWDKIFKRKVFQDILFPVGRNYEGTAIMHKLFSKADTVLLLGNPKYYYNSTPQSIVNTMSLKNILDICLSRIERYYDLRTQYPHLQELLIKSAVKGISKFEKMDTKISNEDINLNIRKFQTIRSFVTEVWIQINEYYGKKRVLRTECGIFKSGRYALVNSFRLMAKKARLFRKVKRVLRLMI